MLLWENSNCLFGSKDQTRTSKLNLFLLQTNIRLSNMLCVTSKLSKTVPKNQLHMNICFLSLSFTQCHTCFIILKWTYKLYSAQIDYWLSDISQAKDKLVKNGLFYSVNLANILKTSARCLGKKFYIPRMAFFTYHHDMMLWIILDY